MGGGIDRGVVTLLCLGALVLGLLAFALGAASCLAPGRRRAALVAIALGGWLAAMGAWPLALPGLGLGLTALVSGGRRGTPGLGHALLEAAPLALSVLAPLWLLVGVSPHAAAMVEVGSAAAIVPPSIQQLLTCWAVLAGVGVLLDRWRAREVDA